MFTRETNEECLLGCCDRVVETWLFDFLNAHARLSDVADWPDRIGRLALVTTMCNEVGAGRVHSMQPSVSVVD